MQSKSGHTCAYQPASGGYWTCGHNIVIPGIDAQKARGRAQIATAQEPGQVSADGTGQAVDAAPMPPASEMPTCPTTAPLAAGGLSEAFARAS